MEIDAVAGPRLRVERVRTLEKAEALAAVGLVEAIGRIPRHLSLLRSLKHRFRLGTYDGIVLVDYPGFHLRVARAAAGYGIPVLYYIPPQVWAWGAWRLDHLRRSVDRLAVILPFETTYFREQGLPVSYVGHPLLDRTTRLTRATARATLGINQDDTVLALFPGSRPQEVDRLWPPMRDATRQVRAAHPNVRPLVAAIEGCAYPGAEDVRLVQEQSQLVMAAATAAICKSGTTTLEAAVADVPHVLVYAMHPVTAAIARRCSTVRQIGLVNLLADQAVVPELLQQDATATLLARAIVPLLDPAAPPALTQRDAFRLVRDRLGTPGAARRVAELALAMAA